MKFRESRAAAARAGHRRLRAMAAVTCPVPPAAVSPPSFRSQAQWTGRCLPVLLALGAVIGFMGGFGIGGGMIRSFPLLTILFTAARDCIPSEHVVHMAVATATATMMFTALSSVHAFAQGRRAVDSGPGDGTRHRARVARGAADRGRPARPRMLAAVFGVFTWASATRQLTAPTPARWRVRQGGAVRRRRGCGGVEPARRRGVDSSRSRTWGITT